MTKATETRLLSDVAAVHERVFNGLGKEIREEVANEIKGLNAKLWALLTSLFITLIAIVVTVLISTTSRSMENDKNYKAIVDIGSRLENHLLNTVRP